MPDPFFMQLYRGAVVRDCPAMWHFFEHRQPDGNDWLQLIAYADRLVELGEEFVDNVNNVANERGLINKRQPPLPVCPNCKREDCRGSVRIVPRVIVGTVEVVADPET